MSHLPVFTLGELKLFAAFSIFLTCYFVFAVGKFPGMKIDRPGAAIIGAVLMVAFGIVRPDAALSAIDFKTIVLLFSMMLIGPYSGISDLVFFYHPAPVAVAGQFVALGAGLCWTMARLVPRRPMGL